MIAINHILPTTSTEMDNRLNEPRQPGPTVRWWPLRYHAEQYAALTSGARFVGLDAGRRSGKTDIAKRFLVRNLNTPKPWQDPRYFYGMPTERQVKRVVWDDLLSLLPNEWIDGGKEGRNVHRGELWIQTNRHGSQIHLLGMDNPARFEGSPWDGGILDEACDLPHKVFDLHVRPALETVQNGINRCGWCWIIGKPSRTGPGSAWFRDFCEKCRRGEYPDGKAFTWPSWDILPEDVIEQARETLEPKDFNEQYGASWENAGGAIFYSFDREYNVRPCSYDSTKSILVGQDFNIDPMCWVMAHQYGDRLEIFDELFVRDCNTPRALDILWGRYANHTGGWQFYGDASGQARKTSASLTDYAHVHNDPRFKKSGRTLHYLAANPELKDRFSCCNVLLCNAAGTRQAFFDPHCRKLIADLEMRSYKTGTNIPADGKDQGHSTDAWGYIVWRLFPPRFNNYGTGEIITTRAR